MRQDSRSESQDSSSSSNQLQFGPQRQELKAEHLVLIKGAQKCMTMSEVSTCFSKWGQVCRLVKKPFTNHYYVSFKDPESVERLAKHIETQTVYLKDKPLNIMRINKVPLDLNQPSKVLLVTFIGYSRDVTVEHVIEIFKKYGVIGKVVIYRKKNIQILMELDNIDSAIAICSEQEKISRDQNVKMKIQFTNKKNLIVEKNCLNEYDSKKGRGSHYSGDHAYSSPGGANSHRQGQGASYHEKPPERWKSSVPEEPVHENNIFQNLRQRDSTNNSLMDRQSYGSFGARYSPGHLLHQEEKAIKRESDTTMMPRRNPQTPEYTRLYESVGRQGIKNQYSSRFSTSAGSENREEDQSFDKMLLIQEIPDDCTHDMIFNLSSLYGNVLEIWLHEEMKLSVVLYESADQVYISQRCLDKLQLFETTLKVKVASEEPTLSAMAQDGDSKDFRSNPNQRFKIPGSKNYNNMNPPSTTIHLSNLPELYELSKLRDMFAPVAVPQNISYFSGSKTMALGNFDSVADATQVLVKFHNYNINGRFIKLAYAKYKLRMTPKIIAHNEELQRMDRGKVDHNGFEFKARSDMKARHPDLRRTDELSEHRFKSSEGYHPSQYQHSKPFYPESYASTSNSHLSSQEHSMTVQIPPRMQSFGRPHEYGDMLGYPRMEPHYPPQRPSLPENPVYNQTPGYPMIPPNIHMHPSEMVSPPAPIMPTHPSQNSYLYYQDNTPEQSPHLPNRRYYEYEDPEGQVPESPTKETSDIVRKVVDYLDL